MKENNENLLQMGFYIDQTRCTGCFSCVIACKDWNDVQAEKVSWRRVVAIEKGNFPDVFMCFLSVSCFHCEKPICAAACPVEAITKNRALGIVQVDQEVCLGGHECEFACQKACPYDMPQFELNENSKMQMCTLCIERLAENKNPICVNACPMRALDFGPMDELKEKYGNVKEVEGFIHSEEINPSIIFKPRY